MQHKILINDKDKDNEKHSFTGNHDFAISWTGSYDLAAELGLSLEPGKTYYIDMWTKTYGDSGDHWYSNDGSNYHAKLTVGTPVESITVNPDEIEQSVGATYSILFTVLPADATNQAVTFSSSDETVATVDEDGTVTGVAAGTATITIAATDGSGVTGTLIVNVTNIDVEAITAYDIMTTVGETATINYEVIPVQATNPAVTFTSANTAIATVDANGVVTGVDVGETTITIASVQNPDVTTEIYVTVQPHPYIPRLYVNDNNITAITATATWTSCDDVTDYTLQLASDNQFTSPAEYTVSDPSYDFISYEITGLTPNTVYYARVKGDFDWSNVIEFTTEEVAEITLADNATNNSTISSNNGKYANVTLSGRTLWKDGAWNTLCLPFTVSTTSGTLAGDNVVAMTLDADNSGLSGTTLTLNFDDAPTSIPAGTPFIIKWSKTNESDPDLTNLKDPVFNGVTIDSNASTEVTFDGGKFVGSYSPAELSAGDKTKLYLGAGNTLYWPSAKVTMNAFRAYFDLGEGQEAHEFVLNFDGESTGISPTTNSSLNGGEWYDLQGRRLAGQPTAKGVYIHTCIYIIVKRS